MKDQVNRDSFVFYRSFFQSIDSCPEDAQLLLYRGIAKYALNRETPNFDGNQYCQFLNAIWAGVRPQLDANFQRYQNGCCGGGAIGNRNNPYGRKGKSKEPTENRPRTDQEPTKNRPKTDQEPTKNRPNVNDNVNDNVNVNVNSGQELVLPYHSKEFVDTWKELMEQPKWKHKTRSALQKSLDSLKRFNEQFSIKLMNQAIANDYQGLVFPSTDRQFNQWKIDQGIPDETPEAGERKVVNSIDDVY